jgi:orotidine-5'-phosphate decarboxylase
VKKTILTAEALRRRKNCFIFKSQRLRVSAVKGPKTFHFNFPLGSTKMAAMPAKEKIIVALDVPSAEAAVQVAQKLHGHVGMFKVGSEVFTAEGPVVARYLVATGEQVFLDLKFHDIPNTIRAAAQQAGMLGVSLLTVHASGGRKMMEAAVDGVRAAAKARGVARSTRVLAVTALTSLGAEDLAEVGFQGSPEEVVIRLARLAQAAGVDGVVASPREIAAIRQACAPNFLIVTAGIRPAAGVSDDQARTATPESAIRAGADYLVIGRPITGAPDPAAAADAIAAEMEKAFTPPLPQAQES